MINKLQLQDTPMSAELAMEQIALEAQFINNLAQAIKNFFPHIFTKIQSNKETALHALDEIQIQENVKLDKDQLFVLKEITRHDFLSYSDIKVMVPNGFLPKKHFIDFIRQLQHSTDHLVTIEKEVLSKFYAEISAFLTNSEDRSSLKDFTSYYKKLGQKSEDDLRKIGTFFRGDDVGYLPIGSVMARSSDLNLIYKELLVLDKKINSIDRAALKDSINKISDVLDLIISAASQKKIEFASAESVKSISSGAMVVAKELEYYSVVFFRVIMIKESVNDLTQALKKFITE